MTGTEAGTAALEVTEMQVDVDGGDRLEPLLEAGTLTVTDDGSATDSSQRGDDQSTVKTVSDDSVTGFTNGTMIAAIAVLAAALLARSTEIRW